MTMIPCIAVEPAWIYTDSQIKIEDLVVAPDGSAVVAGAGKVLLLSQNGSVLGKEPFGEIIVQSRDGSSIVTAYSSTVSSTVYLFKKNKTASGNPTLHKMWEATTPDKVVSVAVSDKGDRIAFSAGGQGVNVYEGKTGKRLGYSGRYSALIAMSGRGTTIAGISAVQGLNLYTVKGAFIKKFDIILSGQPKSLLIDANGTIVVFNTGPHIVAFNVSNGSEIWKRKSSGDINMLAMTPPANIIVAGTESGAIELYDAKGNLNWTYYANNGLGSGHAIKTIALTRDGSKIISGSVDGKIILLDSAGNQIWNYTVAKDPVRRVAIAADGSLAVAASETTIYAFTTGKQSSQSKSVETSVKKTSPSVSSAPTSSTSPESRNITTRDPVSTQQSVVPGIPTITVTEYSIVRTATQSPLEEIAGITALLITIFMFRNR